MVVTILYFHINDSSKGCGIVEYSDINDAARALSNLNGVELKGRAIFVREDREPDSKPNNSKPSGRRDNNNDANTIVLNTPRLYVNNLPYNVAWQDVKDLFRKVNFVILLWFFLSVEVLLEYVLQAGEVRRANVLTGSDGR